MGLIDQLFGGELPTAVRFVIAFGIVLALIAGTFVGLRRFAGRKLPLSNSGGRARQPRLGVLDAFAIDARRRLVLIRRDNVEHLLMIGGPNDVLVESHIVRAPAQAGLAPQRGQRSPAENARGPVQAPPQQMPVQPRMPAAPVAEPPAAGPVSELPQAAPPARTSAFRALQRVMPSAATPVPAPGSAKPTRPVRAENQNEADIDAPLPAAAPPAPPPPAAAPAKPKVDIDPMFADIERKLGEALSRTASPGPASAPQAPAPAKPAPAKPAAVPPPPVRRAPEPAAAAPAKDAGRQSHLDALEEEMASLLGRDRP
jgi:hypothetical protein